jgi:hypothetical protein
MHVLMSLNFVTTTKHVIQNYMYVHFVTFFTHAHEILQAALSPAVSPTVSPAVSPAVSQVVSPAVSPAHR